MAGATRIDTLKAPRSATCRGHGQTPRRSDMPKGTPHSSPTCSVPDCPKRSTARGWCQMHYERWRLNGTTDPPNPPERRFWSRVDKGDGADCWVWNHRLTGHGYGYFFLEGRTVLAHVVAWRWANGPVPTGLELDHRCRNRSCVRPSHLEPVTHRENILRSPTAPAAINARKTHCIHGHEFDDENTHITPEGYRSCRACHRNRERERQRRLRGTNRG